MAYLDDVNNAQIDSLISVVQAFQELFDIDMDTNEAVCIGDSDEIIDVMEYAARVVAEFNEDIEES